MQGHKELAAEVEWHPRSGLAQACFFCYKVSEGVARVTDVKSKQYRNVYTCSKCTVKRHKALRTYMLKKYNKEVSFVTHV